MRAISQNPNPLKFVVQVASPRMSSSVPKMSSLGTAAAAKELAAGTNSPDETNELVGRNELVVANEPVGTDRSAEKLAYCCPVDAVDDQTDGPAGARARVGGADTVAGADADEAAANGTGARRRRVAPPGRVLTCCESNKTSRPSSVTLW